MEDDVLATAERRHLNVKTIIDIGHMATVSIAVGHETDDAH